MENHWCNTIAAKGGLLSLEMESKRTIQLSLLIKPSYDLGTAK
jgi:hypothetical protein